MQQYILQEQSIRVQDNIGVASEFGQNRTFGLIDYFL